MYSGDRLKEKLGGFLKIAVILFMVYVIGYIGLMFVNRVDASDEVHHHMTTTDVEEEHEACNNSTLKNAGVKVPVKCKKN